MNEWQKTPFGSFGKENAQGKTERLRWLVFVRVVSSACRIKRKEEILRLCRQSNAASQKMT